MTLLSWSNVDYFTRNIVTRVGGTLTSVDDTTLLDALRTSNEADQWTWPTDADVVEFGQLDGHAEITGTDSSNAMAVSMARNAAVSRVSTWMGIPVRPVDADGVADPDGAAVPITPAIFLATVMLALQFYTSDGFSAGGGEGGSPELALDPRISTLLMGPPSL